MELRMSNEDASKSVSGPKLPFVLFSVGLSTAPMNLFAVNILPQSVDWIGAFFGLPLIFVSLGCCVAAPFFSSLSLSKRWVCAGGALVIFAIVFLGSLFLCAIKFGTGVH
jgi:hypothetical protein